MKEQLRLRDAVVDAAPIMVSGFFFGLVFGVLASKSGITPLAATLMSALVFAGASQFVAVEQWRHPNLPWLSIVLTTLLINLRHLLMSASLQRSFQKLPKGRVAASFALLLIDETWALAEHRFRKAAPSLRYFVTAGLVIYVGWVGGTFIGTQVGSNIPEPRIYGLDFTFVAMFLSLMVLLWQRQLDFLTWLTAGLLSFLISQLPGLGAAGVVIAAVVASAVVAALPAARQPVVEAGR
ncbi:hypothetical protein BZL41_18435 [Pseudomonas sp. PIC25]|uniref:AzlC family ABC transporter permease n=1 Tax=Pseudomonas sp. PIC25 TaxID=1958773 RepID=UPI000BAB3BF4|nr:AzlC family ABC transporter permease [Pseudomonas sp. PIC25]PAU57665.1 hypothetical protein BZL41_18435 [Pseudomonas sp. PIC25]